MFAPVVDSFERAETFEASEPSVTPDTFAGPGATAVAASAVPDFSSGWTQPASAAGLVKSVEPAAAAAGTAASAQTDAAIDTGSRYAPLEEPRTGTTTGSSAIFHEPEPADGSNPFRLVALVLAIGLAVGAAAGYLVGKRSALQNDSDIVTTVPETAPIAGAGPGAAANAADGSATPAAGSSGAGASGTTGRGNAGGAVGTRSAAGNAAGNAAAAGTAAGGAAARPAATAGRLIVRSSPSRAEVVIDGTRHGLTPLSLRSLPFGSHVVRVTRSGYAPEARRITLGAARPTETLTFELERIAASTPARPAAAPARPSAAPATPAAGTATAGPAAAAAGRAAPDANAPASGLGALFVLSRPAGARVLVDGRPVGVTPLLLQDVAPGTRTVRLEMAGHRPWIDTVQVTAGQRVRVAASLEEGPQ